MIWKIIGTIWKLCGIFQGDFCLSKLKKAHYPIHLNPSLSLNLFNLATTKLPSSPNLVLKFPCASLETSPFKESKRQKSEKNLHGMESPFSNIKNIYNIKDEIRPHEFYLRENEGQGSKYGRIIHFFGLC